MAQERNILLHAMELLTSPIFDADVYVQVSSPYAPFVTYVTRVDSHGVLSTSRSGGSTITGGPPAQHARHVLDRVAARRGSISLIGFSIRGGAEAVTLYDISGA